MKRITALFLMTLLILAMFPVSAFASNSIYEQAYNVHNAISYALKHYQDYNPNYNKLDADCTNFVSQCIADPEAGGINQEGYFKKDGGVPNHHPWTVTPDLYEYLKDKGYESISFQSWQASALAPLFCRPGDVVFYDWGTRNGLIDGLGMNDGKPDHAAFCVGTNKDGIPLVAAHTADHRSDPIVLDEGRYGEYTIYVVQMTHTAGLLDVSSRYVGKTIAIKSIESNQYVSANTDQHDSYVNATANRSTASTWEYFDVVQGDYGEIGFRSRSTGNFLSARIDDNDKYAYIQSAAYSHNYSKPQSWESFRIFEKGGVQYIQSQANGKWVQSATNETDNPLKAAGSAASTWERFQIEIVNTFSNSGSGTTSGNSTGGTFGGSTQGGSSGTTYVENQYYRNPQTTFTEGYYTGEWSNGAPNGYGKIVFSDVNGDGKRYSIATSTTTYYALSYEGNFSNGLRYGRGTTYYEGGYRDEGTYYGAWEADKVVFEGNRWLSNDSYNGYWPSWTIVAANTTTAKSETHGNWVSVSNKATYTVTYNANGGSGAPQPQTKTAGTPLTLSNSKPAREGYAFLGWATNSSASGASYRPGDSFSIDANTTLYAVWELNYVAPPIPTLSATSKSVSLAWTQEDSDGYYLWRYDWSLPYEQASKRLNNGNPVYSSYVDNEIVQGREYSYQLQSVRIAREREYDGYGNSVSVTIPFTSQALEKSIPSSWAQDSIIKAYDMGLIPEYMLADYSRTTTRIDFVRLAFNAIEQHSGWMQQILYDNGLVDSIEFGPSLIFDDVPFNCGYDEYDGYRVAALNALGIVLGVGNDKFEPYREITREEAAVLLSRVHSFLRWGEVRSYSYKDSTNSLYADNDSISSWAVYDVYNMKAIDVMNGIGSNRFSPKGTYTIEQSIVTFVRLLNK